VRAPVGSLSGGNQQKVAWRADCRPVPRFCCSTSRRRASTSARRREPDARDFFVNQATAEGIGNTLTDEAARLLGGRGEFAVITGALTAANQNE
jgi:hypothetical protein